MPMGTIDIPVWAQVTRSSSWECFLFSCLLFCLLCNITLYHIISHFCIKVDINSHLNAFQSRSRMRPISNFRSFSAHLNLRHVTFHAQTVEIFLMRMSHLSVCQTSDVFKVFFSTDDKCLQSSSAYHASLAHKTNHSFLPNGLFY